MVLSVVALGSNLGDRLATLNGAVTRLSQMGTVYAVSGLYETAPIGGPDQDPYYNAVVVLDTRLSAHDLLGGLHEIEADFDRTREVRWGPRTLDLDLILHGETVVADELITLPHPRYRERRFVLEPLVEAWPDVHDPDGTPVASLLESVLDQQLERVDGAGWAGGQVLGDARGAAAPGRGGRWVVGQSVALVAFLATVLLTVNQFSSSVVVIGGVAIAGGGAVQMVAAISGLGSRTTPFPEPLSGGGVVSSGIYGLVRHPMYGALMLAALGLAAMLSSWVGLVGWPLLVAFFVRKARHEEIRMVMAYPEYVEYRRVVGQRFVPWLI